MPSNVPIAVHIEMMKHALGLDYPNKVGGYRNYYVVNPLSVDTVTLWDQLVEVNYATKRKSTIGDNWVFHVTKFGAEQIGVLKICGKDTTWPVVKASEP